MFTEKFALLNLLKAIESLSPKPDGEQSAAKDSDTRAPERQRGGAPAAENGGETNTYPNFMLGVLERHEAISNRVRNKK